MPTRDAKGRFVRAVDQQQQEQRDYEHARRAQLATPLDVTASTAKSQPTNTTLRIVSVGSLQPVAPAKDVELRPRTAATILERLDKPIFVASLVAWAAMLWHYILPAICD